MWKIFPPVWPSISDDLKEYLHAIAFLRSFDYFLDSLVWYASQGTDAHRPHLMLRFMQVRTAQCVRYDELLAYYILEFHIVSVQPQYEGLESYRCLTERLLQNGADWCMFILDDNSPTKSVLVETLQPINHRKQLFLDLCPSAPCRC